MMTFKYNMKSLFNENFRYTDEANAVAVSASIACRHIMDEWAGYGYSPREIAYIMKWAISDLELEKLIEMRK